MTTRKVSRVVAPVCCTCALCCLAAKDDDDGVLNMEIQYGEGNELAALWKRPYVCRACIEALAKGLEEL